MILYKKDTKGKIRQLFIHASGANLVQESGLVGGKQVVHIKECKEKNVGKSNYMNKEDQAIFEAEALITKKLREGYFKTKEEAENEEIILPMLAKSYDKEKHKIDWSTAYAQPKLDGMRCLAIIKDGDVKLISRKGVEIDTMPHIVEQLKECKQNMVVDGELYCHGISFQENMKLIKKYREGESEKVAYNIYDIATKNPYARFPEVYPSRIARLRAIKASDTIKIVRSEPLGNETHLKGVHARNIRDGYEGTMVRHGTKPYKINGRCDQLLKYKDFIDEVFEVVDVVPMEVYTDQGMVVCKNKEGATFTATPKMSHEDKRVLLKNKSDYIGQTAEVRFFEWTDDGLPRFPICVGFRLDK